MLDSRPKQQVVFNTLHTVWTASLSTKGIGISIVARVFITKGRYE